MQNNLTKNCVKNDTFEYLNTTKTKVPINSILSDKISKIKAKILTYVKAHPEEQYIKVSNDFGTNNIVYAGKTSGIDGNRHIALMQFIKA